MTQASDLRLVHLEEMSDHYARTLRAWRERFWERREEARALGYTERFLRKWEYYLRYCEAAFEERQVNVVQMLLAKPRCHVDPLAISVPAVESPSALAAAREGNETPPALRPRSAAAPCLKGGT
jgi:cyclopropane-fatty-acyl-phospholipid synthase